MSENISEEVLPAETCVVLPINYDGVGPINILDGIVYMTLWCRQQKPDGSGFEHIIVGRTVANKAVVQSSIFALTKALARSAMFGLPVKARRDGH